MEAVSPLAIEAALEAAQRVIKADDDVRQATKRDLENARYEASLASRRNEAVDPAKRLVASELESRWNIALERVAGLEQRLTRMDEQAASRPQVDKNGLLTLAHDLASAWNAPGASMRTKRRLTRIVIQEVVIDRDDSEFRHSILRPQVRRRSVLIKLHGVCKICAGSVLRLIKAGILPAQQLMPCTPWRVPVEALESKACQERRAGCNR